MVFERHGKGKAFAGIVNALFYGDNFDVVHGDAQAVLVEVGGGGARGLGLAAAA